MTPVSTSGLRYKEIKERRDHDQRQSNVIIHGVAECSEKKEDGDNKFVETLVKTIKISTPTIKSISRIGAEAVDKKRPIKVVLGSEKEKMTFLRNLSPLKGNKRYEGVSVTEDLTPTERSVLKEWTDKAKDLNLDYTLVKMIFLVFLLKIPFLYQRKTFLVKYRKNFLQVN